MKKAYFNDDFNQTQAVINGTKTQFRQIVPQKALDAWNDIDDGDEYSRSVYAESYEAKLRNFLLKYATYKVGEEVAVAQCYEDAILDVGEEKWNKRHKWYNINYLCHEKGLHNKMFVKAGLMPYKIEITDISVERLQDISDADCLAEGIEGDCAGYEYSCGKNRYVAYKTPKIAYSSLINNMCGKGTWERNPWVFVYKFQLITK